VGGVATQTHQCRTPHRDQKQKALNVFKAFKALHRGLVGAPAH
jgi:hypothetical protein